MATYGEVSWDDKSAGYANSDSKGSDIFLRLENGPNTVRLVTKPQQYIVHEGVKREGDKGYGTKVLCSKVHGSCPLCDAGYDVRPRWFLGVIDRKSNSYRVLDISSSVFFDIKTLNSGKWGDPSKYDIDIIKNDKADPQHYYSVQPIERYPLSASDQKIIDEQMDMAFLTKKITPPTLEQTEKRLEKILEGGKLAAPVKKERPKKDKNGSGKSATTSSMTSMAQSDVDTAGDGLTDIFPNHDETETVSS